MFLLIVISAGLSRFKLLLDTGTTSYGLVGLKAVAFVMLCLFLTILLPIGLQTRKLRDRTEVAVRQRFNLACDARTCGCVPIILYRPRCNILELPPRMDSIAGLFVHASVVSRDMVSCLGASLLSHSIHFGALARCEEGIPSLSTTDRLLLGSG